MRADLVAENAEVLAGFSCDTRQQLVELIAMLTKAARQRQLESAG